VKVDPTMKPRPIRVYTAYGSPTSAQADGVDALSPLWEDAGRMMRSEQLPTFRRVAADLQIRIEFFTRITTPMAKG
jgi:hypothetical protein